MAKTNGANGANQIIKVGIVGTGEVAQTTHLPTLALLSHQFRVVALCDVSSNSLQHCATKFHISKTYTDYAELLQDDEVDLVMIMNSDEYHASMAVQAADAKKHVFVEKPMALTHQDAAAIVAAQKRNQVVIFVGYMRRYAAAFETAKTMIQSLKQIQFVRVRDIIGFNQFFVDESGFFPQKFTDFPEDMNADRIKRGKEIAETALGSDLASNPRNVRTHRLLGGLGSHDLSAMRELIGMPKRCLMAARGTNGVFVNALFEYDGFVVSYETGLDSVAKFDAHIEVYGGDKHIKLTYDTPYIKGLPITVTVQEQDANGHFSERVIRPTYTDAYTLEMQALYDCLAHGAQCKTTPQDAAQDLVIFDMLMQNLAI